MAIRVGLTIAGSDSGGGAGIQADIKTFSALGVYATSVITALTAQNTVEVMSVQSVPPQFIRHQMRALASDIRIDAVKIGMLANKQIIAEVATGLRAATWSPIVLDPVIVAQSGARLLADDAIDLLVTELFPLASIITPNIPEAAALLGINETEVAADLQHAARALMNRGASAVLVKGGHAAGKTADDWFVSPTHVKKLSTPRLDTPHTHGSGCTLSSAICAYLAQGDSILGAVEKAKAYVHGAIAAGVDLHIGKGSGPLHHFYGMS